MAAKKDTTPKTPGPASDKKQALETALAQIEKQFGKGAVMKLGANIAMQVDAIPTGSLGLDLALGIGGVPRGRIIEVYGPESSGKTTLALHILADTFVPLLAVAESFIDNISLEYGRSPEDGRRGRVHRR